MKTHRLEKGENSREVREAKESEEKLRKVPTEEVAEEKTPNDLDLAIAEMVHNRQPYNVIAKKLKVSPKTISKAKKKIEEGTIKIAENGKAKHCKNSESMEIGPLPTQLQREIMGAAHLEGKSPQEVIAHLIRLDRKIRLKDLTLEQIEPAVFFLGKADACGWTIDQLVDMITRLISSGLSDLNQQSMDLLPDFLESAKSRNLKPEHIIQIYLEREEEAMKKLQEIHYLGIQHGIRTYKERIIELIAKIKFIGIETLCEFLDSAEKKAMDDARTPI